MLQYKVIIILIGDESMIVVTGAAGLVGTVLTRQLVEDGNKVKAIVTDNDDLRLLESLDIELIVGDVRDIDFLVATFQVASTVYHLAGIVSITEGDQELIEEVNVGGTQNVIDACIQADVKKLLYMSSVHAIVELPQGKLIDETAEIIPDKVVGDYAKSKAKATLAVKKAIEQGLDAIIVYPSGIIGPYSYSVTNMGQLLIDYTKGKIPVLIDGTYDFVDVRDVVTGTISARENGMRGEGYILSGYQITINQLFAILSSVTNRKMPKLFLPNWLIKLFIPLVSIFTKMLNKKPTLTSYALYTLASNSLFSHEKAYETLNYYPRHITKTIKDTIHWYEKIGLL